MNKVEINRLNAETEQLNRETMELLTSSNRYLRFAWFSMGLAIGLCLLITAFLVLK